MSDLKTILNRAMNDDEYARTLREDPAGAMTQAGVEATPEKIAALKASMDSLAEAHKTFGGGMMRPD